MRSLLFVVPMLLLACNSTILDPKAYDRTCTADADCAAVYMGDTCALCACPNSGVNVKAQAKHQADLEAARRLCGPQPAVQCAACQTFAGACDAGTCVAKTQ